MSKSVNALIGYLFEEFKLKKIVLTTSTENKKSESVAYRSGFKLI